MGDIPKVQKMALAIPKPGIQFIHPALSSTKNTKYDTQPRTTQEDEEDDEDEDGG